MFTGIIEAVGTVRSLSPRGGDLRIVLNTGQLDLGDVRLGDSIACNGVCLTVIELPGEGYAADVSRETLQTSTLGTLQTGSPVNLEKALTLSSRLGGHLVSGHVDGIGEVVERRDDARSIRLRIQAPPELLRYIAPKGSICVDGTSLTVNRIKERIFELNIVPHTASRTVIDHYRPGFRVNLEVDLIARYLERLMGGAEDPAPTTDGLTLALLERSGFVRNRQ